MGILGCVVGFLLCPALLLHPTPVLSSAIRNSVRHFPRMTVPGWEGEKCGLWNEVKNIVPRSYVCTRVNPTLPVNVESGDVRTAAWEHAAWTQAFVDIEGDKKPIPWFETRMKMMWDDEALYVGAWMEEPQVVATLIERDSVIFHDNDFEIFIDGEGKNHNYYELEVNALNTLWELRLNKPYRDGGSEHSERVGMQGHCTAPPRSGTVWRMQSSRVQWKWRWVPGEGAGGRWEKEKQPGHGLEGEDNWTWTPQGVINVHNPERWGFVHFSEGGDGSAGGPVGDWAARELLMEVYYRVSDFKKAVGKLPAGLEELGIESGALDCGLEAREDTEGGFVAWVQMEGGRRLCVREDSLLWTAEGRAD